MVLKGKKISKTFLKLNDNFHSGFHLKQICGCCRYSKPCQITKMERLVKIVNSLDLLTIFAIRFTIDVSHVSESASVSYQTVALEIFVVGAILNQQNFTVYR